jgi:cytochrome c-type biogenesis protein CcmH/NrfF
MLWGAPLVFLGFGIAAVLGLRRRRLPDEALLTPEEGER